MSPIEIQWVQQTLIKAIQPVVDFFNGRLDRARERHDALDARVARLEQRIYGEVPPLDEPDIFKELGLRG